MGALGQEGAFDAFAPIESSHSDNVVYEPTHWPQDILLLFMSDFGNKFNLA